MSRQKNVFIVAEEMSGAIGLMTGFTRKSGLLNMDKYRAHGFIQLKKGACIR